MRIRQFTQRLAILAAVPVGAVACGDSTGPGEYQVRYQVASDSIPCTPWYGPSMCLSVRTLERGHTWSNWEPLYNSIEGFGHQPGFTYELIVGVTPIPNPPADGSSVAERLIKVLSKVPAANK